MNTFLIKVLWEGKEIVFRDLQVAGSKSLFELHHAIAKAFGLDSNQLAGFTKYDDSLQFETDYQIEAFDENSSLMKDHQVGEVLEKPGDVLDYTFDFLKEIKFSLEVIEVYQDEDEIRVIKKHGELPKEVGSDVDPEEAESILIQAMLDEAEDDEEEDDDDDIFGQGGYESLDDYEEFL